MVSGTRMFPSKLPIISHPLTNTSSLLFDGTDDYVESSASSAIVTGNNVTYVAWVNVNDTDVGYIMQSQKGAGSSSLALVVNQNSSLSQADGRINAIVWSGSAHGKVEANPNLDTAGWTHVALTTSSSAQVIYVNGVSIATGSLTFASAASSAAHQIGRTGGSGGNYIGAYLDEVAVFNAVLSASQVLKIYNEGKHADLSEYAGLTAWWRMEGNVRDSYGSNHGTLSGATFSVNIP